MLQFPPGLTLDEKFDFLIALAQERNDAKRKAKGAKPECRDKPVVSKTGRVVKPATVQCGSVCRQKQNCKITKKQLETVRKQMPGASRREVAEAIKKAMAKKREGMGTQGALYEGTKGARGARGNERIEARKRKGEQKAKPKSSQGVGASPDYEKKLKELENVGKKQPTRIEEDGTVFFNGQKVPKEQADLAIKAWEEASKTTRGIGWDPKIHFRTLFEKGSIPNVIELIRAKAGDKAAEEFAKYAVPSGFNFSDSRSGEYRTGYDIPITGAQREIEEWRRSRAALYLAGLVDTPDDVGAYKKLEESGIKKWGKGTSETVTIPSMKKWNFHPELEQISERLGYLRRSNVQKGADVVSDYDARIGSIGAYTQFVVVGRSRDGQTVRVEPSDLTKEQKAERKKNPKAYVREVPASSLYNTEATGLLRDRDAMLIMAETGTVPKGWEKSEESVIKAQDMDALARELFERNPHLLRNRQDKLDSLLPHLGFGLNPTPFYHPLWDLMGY